MAMPQQTVWSVQPATTPMLRQLHASNVVLESTMAMLIPALLATTVVWDITLLKALSHAVFVQLDIMTAITTQLHHATMWAWHALLGTIYGMMTTTPA